MGSIETLAAKLAEDTLEIMDATGADRLYVEVGNVLATASQTLEEAYLTEIRVRLAERTARRFLERRAEELREGGGSETEGSAPAPASAAPDGSAGAAERPPATAPRPRRPQLKRPT